mmetsp:Transcript_9524/g.20849  ORF Transcript_9524/g.20849 Transcript_9524/m.20849 type:complete len:103 (-) Transcript_9524:147-455(-)
MDSAMASQSGQIRQSASRLHQIMATMHPEPSSFAATHPMQSDQQRQSASRFFSSCVEKALKVVAPGVTFLGGLQTSALIKFFSAVIYVRKSAAPLLLHPSLG